MPRKILMNLLSWDKQVMETETIDILVANVDDNIYDIEWIKDTGSRKIILNFKL
ncbi:14776_t:CDS:2 [Acaulospora colombiana]|uniref:14776_t:CDS:1 n=1 Tax=Acaulospora colombiana TaxID=27376 RepID=A0ACA9L6S5_9GLOM|nr:14776_t:CDS:2 [Acaulospora colombiana]